MIIRKSTDLRWSQVTPKSEYFSRRRFLGAFGAGTALAGIGAQAATKLTAARSPFSTSEPQTAYKIATEYNNFYEFGTEKDEPHRNAHTLRTRPWTITTEGAGAPKQVFDIDTIGRMAPFEERIYRLRCVEGWSMVIPWIGFPLAELIKRAQPSGNAKFVAFESLYDSKQMPGAQWAGIPFPYKEGLRMDEAMHPLTLLCVGMYGEVLPNQNGAPVRIVVPWKYGFKSIKSVVKIRFTDKEPSTTWRMSNSREYGFYSNVNPEVDHPRWSQASERRLPELFRRPTQMFNGYGEQVAGLYNGMDLRKLY